MVQFMDTKEIILALKKVWEEKELSIDKTLALVNEKVGEGAVSRSTVQRVFAKGSEDNPASFRYETTLKPLCNALLDMCRKKAEGLGKKSRVTDIDAVVRKLMTR